MIQETSILEKSVLAGSAITAFTIAQYGANDNTMIPGAAAADFLVGVFQHGALSGAEVRVMLVGVSRLKIGGTVTRGDIITTDASGQGVAAAPIAGTNNRIIGVALASGVTGDIIPVFLAQSRPQG